MKIDRYWWLKVLVLIIALAGVFWARKTLDETTQPKTQQELPVDPIPAKVEVGN